MSDSYYEIEVTFHEGTRTPLYEYKRVVDREPLKRGTYLTTDEREAERESDYSYVKHPTKEEVDHTTQKIYTQKVAEIDIVAVIAAINAPIISDTQTVIRHTEPGE